MRIVHERDGTVDTLADEVTHATTYLQRMRGLMFAPPLDPGEALVFPFRDRRRRSVHTLFVRAPIDVVWTDREEVTRVASMSPWTLRRVARCDAIVELPAGGAADVAVGDHVRIDRDP